MTSSPPAAPLADIVAYIDQLLRTDEIRDWKNALNGLQVASAGVVRRIGAAVDASEQTIVEAARRSCDLLVVHHGLFWGGNRAVTGARYRRLKALFDADMAVYSAHLPLDVHPELGNNALLMRALGLEPTATFAQHEGRDIGMVAECDVERPALMARLEGALGGAVRLIAGGPERVRRVGLLTGSGGSLVEEAAARGIDTLITGEGSHHTFVDAHEAGINLMYGGHYATEVWGVRALAENVGARFKLPWEFIDAPTGM